MRWPLPSRTSNFYTHLVTFIPRRWHVPFHFPDNRPIKTSPHRNSPHRNSPLGYSPPWQLAPWQLAPWAARSMDSSPHGQLTTWIAFPMDSSPHRQRTSWTACPMDNSPCGQLTPWWVACLFWWCSDRRQISASKIVPHTMYVHCRKNSTNFHNLFLSISAYCIKTVRLWWFKNTHFELLFLYETNLFSLSCRGVHCQKCV